MLNLLISPDHTMSHVLFPNKQNIYLKKSIKHRHILYETQT